MATSTMTFNSIRFVHFKYIINIIYSIYNNTSVHNFFETLVFKAIVRIRH